MKVRLLLKSAPYKRTSNGHFGPGLFGHPRPKKKFGDVSAAEFLAAS
jgi:hypothetical protein